MILPLHDRLGPLRDCVIAAQGEGIPVSSILGAVGAALADGYGLPTEQGRILALVALYQYGAPGGVPTAWIARGLGLPTATEQLRIYRECCALARGGRLEKYPGTGWRIPEPAAPAYGGRR